MGFNSAFKGLIRHTGWLVQYICTSPNIYCCRVADAGRLGPLGNLDLWRMHYVHSKRRKMSSDRASYPTHHPINAPGLEEYVGRKIP
jgi:hypothetical protein